MTDMDENPKAAFETALPKVAKAAADYREKCEAFNQRIDVILADLHPLVSELKDSEALAQVLGIRTDSSSFSSYGSLSPDLLTIVLQELKIDPVLSYRVAL